MGRPTVALHITTRLFREALSRALHPHVEVVIVPECPDEQRRWFDDQQPVDLAVVSGVEGTSEVDAPVVVEVAAPGTSQGRVTGSDGAPVRTLEDLLALLPPSVEEGEGSAS